jgi:hypothetical protein
MEFIIIIIIIIIITALFLGPQPLSQFQDLTHSRQDSFDGDQSATRLLPTHRSSQTQNKRKHNHASSGIQTHDPKIGVGNDCLRSRGHCDKQTGTLHIKIINVDTKSETM